MNIHQQLLKVHSKENTRLIAAYIGNDQERFAELMAIFSSDDWMPVQRGAWVVAKVCADYPDLLASHLDDLLQALENPLHPAVLRNGLKVLAEAQLSLTEEQEGRLVQLAFEQLEDPKVAVAIQVHAMQCIANLLPVYPDLAIELKAILEAGMEHGSPGFRSRAKKILKQIAKMGPNPAV